MSSALYTLADQLATTLTCGVSGVVMGTAEHMVDINGTQVPVSVDVVSSLVTKTKGSAVLVQMNGNLAVLVLAGFDSTIRSSLCLLDVAKFDRPLENFIEGEQITSLADLVIRLKPATVKVFHKKKDRVWREAEVPA